MIESNWPKLEQVVSTLVGYKHASLFKPGKGFCDMRKKLRSKHGYAL